MSKQEMPMLVFNLALSTMLWNSFKCTEDHACFAVFVSEAFTVVVAPQSGTRLPEGDYSLNFKADGYSFYATWHLGKDGAPSEFALQDVSNILLKVRMATTEDGSGRLKLQVEFACPDKKLNRVTATLAYGGWEDGFEVHPSYNADQPTTPWGDEACGICFDTRTDLPEIAVPIKLNARGENGFPLDTGKK